MSGNKAALVYVVVLYLGSQYISLRLACQKTTRVKVKAVTQARTIMALNSIMLCAMLQCVYVCMRKHVHVQTHTIAHEVTCS